MWIFFNDIYKKTRSKKQTNFPKRFLFVGRYVQLKGLMTLFNAFIELQESMPNVWELWCIGAGELTNKFPHHSKIKDKGFLQPKDLVNSIKDIGVLVLPSNIEAWGVVAHEFAAAGLPLICSNAVGAASEFLEEGENGFIFPANDKNALKEKMKQCIQASSDTLIKMGEHSHQLAQHITPDSWSITIINLLSEE